LLLSKILENNKGAIISTPKKVSNQKDVFDNKYETHKSQWTKDQLTTYGESFFFTDSVSYIAYLSTNKEQSAALRREFFMRKVKRIPAMDFVINTKDRVLAKYKKIRGHS
jgi:hypothetical protein